jgi:two-component system chemotaxis response regulator CheY
MTRARNTILVIDDSALVRKQIKDALAGAGHPTIEAADGEEGLRLLEGGDVALVITDFMMPKMSGLELIGAIRRNPSCADVPIIVLSTLGTGTLVQQGWDLGVKAWLKKPFKPNMLVSAVASLLPSDGEGEAARCAS